MTTHTHDFPDWPFPDPISTAAFCTDKVAREDFDVLVVVHDFNGDWQFLDGTTDEPGECVLLCLGCVFEKHADMAAVADLPRGWGACRDDTGAEWERWELDPEDDQDEDDEDGPHACGGPEADAKALADIEQYGLHVISVMEDDDHPPFTYSIGIEQSLGMPELIVIGLASNVACSAINECYRQMKEGAAIAPGARVADLLGGGFECLIGGRFARPGCRLHALGALAVQRQAVPRLADHLAEHHGCVPVGTGRQRLARRAPAVTCLTSNQLSNA
jgi:Domain of unknown function (DUF4262)